MQHWQVGLCWVHQHYFAHALSSVIPYPRKCLLFQGQRIGMSLLSQRSSIFMSHCAQQAQNLSRFLPKLWISFQGSTQRCLC